MKMKIEHVQVAVHREKPEFFYAGGCPKEAVLLSCLEGSMVCAWEGTVTQLDPGEFLLLPPETWHMYFAVQGSAPVVLQAAFAVEGADFAPVHSRSDRIADLARECALKDAHSDQMCDLYLQQLLVELQRQEQMGARKYPKGDAAILLRAQRIICDNAQCKLSVPEIARRAGVSASYLTALFHKHLPFSPGAYIRRVKLEESRAMIREGTLNFTQIAQVLEYSTVHQFSRQFKEVFGMTPSEYAKTVGP